MGYPLSGESENTGILSTHNIFNDKIFWKNFEDDIRSKVWKVNFPTSLLTDSIEKDSQLYSNDTVFRHRRQAALKWIHDDDLWTKFILGACKELANKIEGPYYRELQDLRMLEPFSDFVGHINFFYKVALIMKFRGFPVRVMSDITFIHDVDKLHPAMMVGYAERFEDNVTTSLWNVCVDKHTTIHIHHQANHFWHDSCEKNFRPTFCEYMRGKGLCEMVCDKVSRKVQKELGGRFSEKMWEVDMVYFKGIPEEWLQKAEDMLHDLRNGEFISNTTTIEHILTSYD